MLLRAISLTDKFAAQEGRVFLTGTQALVRLPLLQHRIDAAAGHRTAGYISGYRGSPLGGYDQQLAAAASILDSHEIRFNPGINEELAATACWGTQQSQLSGDARYDGVFAIWYGKGPGVDRSGDVFKHANLAGTSRLGGVIALMGDDHTCESSTTAHQSEFAMVDAMMPILNPAGIQELVDYGLYGFALSRYSGCWVGIKCVKDTIDASGTVDASVDRALFRTPEDFAMPAGGLHIRYPDPPLEQEARLHDFKIEAVKAFARANTIDRIVIDSPAAKIGIVACGKSYLDVRQALDNLGVDDGIAGELGIRLYKVGIVWPLEPAGAARFAVGLDLIVVVEEKRSLIETQLKELLYSSGIAPAVIGKRDENGARLFASSGALEPNDIAIAIGERILRAFDDTRLAERVAALKTLRDRPPELPAMERTPYFCSGCPHSTGTRLPEGSRAVAGIGCHFMAQWMDRNTSGYTQMGGEGASWVGVAPFVDTPHIFQNIGDGTYVHSGSLAVRAAIASGTRLTYKILYNEAVAMTGGQRLDGRMTVRQIALQLQGEGASRIAVVSDDPQKYQIGDALPPDVTVHPRDQYVAVQERFRAVGGVTVIIYDQMCAAEKRRRRKRDLFPDPPLRVLINPLVCEGCGDCGVKSNCVSVIPLETEFGRKRAIDQSACNKDLSCIEGFCPSFVTVVGGKLRKPVAAAGQAGDDMLPDLTEPALPALADAYGILITGVGGTGIVTIGAIVGMAAHLEGKSFRALDMAGLAQKGGAVWSHLQVAQRDEDIYTPRIARGNAKLILGCDLVSAASRKTLETAGARTYAVVNTHAPMTGEFTRNAALTVPSDSLQTTIHRAVPQDNVHFVDASRLAATLLGDSIATNMFILGYAYQLGLLPVSANAVSKAIELNGTDVAMNLAAFSWGRHAVVSPEAVERLAKRTRRSDETWKLSMTLDEVIDRRIAYLTDYQDAAWADRYRRLVDQVRAVADEFPEVASLTDAVARNFFKLMAYKDEYEVARLYSDARFLSAVDQQFEGATSLRFHLAPPLWSKRDPITHEPKKQSYGPWVMHAFKLLASMKRVRGTRWDVFGYTSERRTERSLIDEYETTITNTLKRMNQASFAVAIQIARVPEDIRGFGHVKQRSLMIAAQKRTALLSTFDALSLAAARSTLADAATVQ